MRFVIGLGFIILLVSCATTTHSVCSWRGARASALLDTWGEPDAEVVSPNGHVLLVYKSNCYRACENSCQSPESIGVTLHGCCARPRLASVPNVPYPWSRRPMNCSAAFEVNQLGTIVGASVQGDCGRNDFACMPSNAWAIPQADEGRGLAGYLS